MKTTKQQALVAKTALRDILRSVGIKAACGIAKIGDDYAVKINVENNESAIKVPAKVMDVTVLVVVTSQARAKNNKLFSKTA